MDLKGGCSLLNHSLFMFNEFYTFEISIKSQLFQFISLNQNS